MGEYIITYTIYDCFLYNLKVWKLLPIHNLQNGKLEILRTNNAKLKNSSFQIHWFYHLGKSTFIRYLVDPILSVFANNVIRSTYHAWQSIILRCSNRISDCGWTLTANWFCTLRKLWLYDWIFHSQIAWIA